MSDEVTTVLKRGENVLIFTLHRSPEGIRVSVKVHQAVEEFMRQLSGVEVQTFPVTALGKYWVPIGDTPLLAYRLAEPLNGVDGDLRWTVDPIAEPLLLQVGGRRSQAAAPPGTPSGSISRGLLDDFDPSDRPSHPSVNLSFLRLVGASEGAGITFGLKGVQSLEALRETKDKVGAGFRSFYNRYLLPIDLTAIVSTRELKA